MRDRLTSDKPEEMNNRSVAELREKLKKYEDICMYPEKLKEISGLFLEKCQEVNRLKKELETQNDRWIPCSLAMPPVETDVFIIAKRKSRGGDCIYIRTTAMYEDGTLIENDSCWGWQNLDGEWDEENDCYIIPEGWWEIRHYNQDDVYNNVVDDEVVAWQPLPPEYQPKGGLEKQKYISRRKQTNADRIREMSDEELMKIIMCPYDIYGIPVNMMPCVRNGNIQELIPPEECNKCMMEWLQSGVEE